MSRPLVLAAHGTADPAGQAVVAEVAAAAARELGVPHRLGYVDVCGPTLDEVLAGSDPEAAAPVVVPFFLASGYHVRHDVPSAVAQVSGATVTPALGVAPEVVDALVARVLEACSSPGAVVVIGAGSSVGSARAEVAEVARLVGARLGVPATEAFLSGPGPRPEEAAAALEGRADGAAGGTAPGDGGRGHGGTTGTLVLAAHLLAPGHFLMKAHRVAADLGGVSTAPLGTHPLLRDLVVRLYREAAAG